jgi:hypothetical protein
MTIDTLTPPDVIELMIDLRIQQAELEQEINALKPAFFDACAQQNTDHIPNERALIFCKLTPGQWNYPEDIIEHEQQLKQLKQDFRENHEPAAGREISWALKLLTAQD